QLARAVARHTGAPELERLLLASSWGSLWKPSAWRGDLCFGPNQGRNVTFVNPRRWLGPDTGRDAQPLEPHSALQETARRYLRAYGPATPEDFARWWDGSAGIVPAKKLFRSIEDELEAVDVEGWHALALRSTLEPMQKIETPPEAPEVVRLLPLFDAYTLGLGRDVEPILPGAHKSRVFRPQGWISAVVLVDGRMRGVWEYETRPSQTTVKVSTFATPAASIREGIAVEAERLSTFLEAKVVLKIEDA
ncbi:MAG TPA: crosslink repair DNA glycosylase YcaQ family protein, partial [Chloroflexia bacterium]|nr:crosslink repair DNA glycosylase YcaQ family protein [Chloroflexia bacterium]